MTTTTKIATANSVNAVAPVRSKVSRAPVAPASAGKSTPKVAAKPVAKRSVSSAKVVAKPLIQTKEEKPAKVKKPKLVRDSFTIPKAEYTVLDELKQRAGKLESSVKKSELLRAGVKALAAMSDVAFLAALKAVPAIKTGRPKRD